MILLVADRQDFVLYFPAMRISTFELRRGLDRVVSIDAALDLDLPGDWFSHPVETTAAIRPMPGGWKLDLILCTQVGRVCDRCLGDVQLEVEEEERCLILESGEAGSAEGEDRVLSLSPDQEWVELDQVLRDVLRLSQPEYVLCRPECRGLCPGCGQDLNEGDCACQPAGSDSPFQDLAGLKRPS